MSRKTRKLIWSAPLVAVLAVAGALAIFAALGPGSSSAHMLPAAPGELTVEAADGDAGRTTLVLNWGPAANASGYRIDISDQGGVWETMMMDTGSTATTYMDDTLTADDTRWYRVFARNGHDIGPVSNAASGTTDAKVRPGSVMNLRAVPNAKNPRKAIDLSWEAPAMDGGEKIVGYEVQFHNGTDWGPFGATFTANQVSVTTKMELTDSMALDPGDSRLYRVRAINGPDTVTAGDGVAATTTENTVSKDWVRVTGTTSAAMPPGQVTGLTAVNTGAQQISLYWYAPEDTGGWDISGYLIQARREGKRFPAIPSDANLTTTESTDVTLGADPTMDNMNRFIGVPAAGVAQVTFDGITAIDTTEDGTANATQQRWYFQVFALTTDDGADDATGGTGANADTIRRSRSPSNVASDTAGARAFDHDGDADRTDETATPVLDPLAAPTITPTGTSSAANDGALKQQINLGLALDGTIATNNGFTAPRSIAGKTPVSQIAYRIDYSEDLGATWKLLERDTRFTGFGADKPYEDDKGLAFDEQRHYRVFAIGRHPYSDVGPPSTLAFGWTLASGPPKKPTGVMASAPSLRSIMASWTEPEDNGGQPITKYLVQWVKDDGDGVAEAADFTTNTDTSLDDDSTDDATTMHTFDIAAANALAGDTVYVFRVAAVNQTTADPPVDRPADVASVGTDDWSDLVLVSTAEASKPNAVEGLTSELATDASGNNRGVNLLWNKPSDMIAITRYEVEVQDEHGDWVNPTGGDNVSPSRTSYTDSDEPEMNEMRVYQVRAVNGVGDGPWTKVYYPREPDTHTHVAPSGTIPAQTVTVDMTGTVDASMYFSNNTDATYAAESDMPMYATVMADENSGMVTITGVAEGTATITVTATSGAVMAEQEFMVTVTPAALGAPTNVMATYVATSATAASVTVTWTDGANADVHDVGLVDLSDYSVLIERRVPGVPSPMTATFNNVPPGRYMAVVASSLGTNPLMFGGYIVEVR